MAMPGVSGGTGQVSTLRIVATSMDNITVSEEKVRQNARRATWLCVGVCGSGRDGSEPGP